MDLGRKRSGFIFWKSLASRARRSLSAIQCSVKALPWRSAVGLGIGLAIALALFRFASFWLGHWTGPSLAPPGVTGQPRPEPVEAEGRSVPARAVESQSTPGSFRAGTDQQKAYAIQVCTYQRERDAQQLTNELRGLNFSAFYQRILSPDQKIPFYLVFLGRTESYAAAKAQLEQFRRTALYQKFTDSFVRSI